MMERDGKKLKKNQEQKKLMNVNGTRMIMHGDGGSFYLNWIWLVV